MTRFPRCRASAFAVLALLTYSVGSATAENWPQWRGAKLDGVSHEKGLPVKWSKTENIAWRLELPGAAGATPVIWGDHIYLTSADSDKLILMCVNTAGKELWRQTVSSGNKNVRGDEGNSASNSPCTDGKHVWAMMADGMLACYSAAGKEVWKLSLPERYGKFQIAFGMTSTPVLDNGRLYLQLIHGDGKAETREAVVVCLDAASGKEIWKADRPSDGEGECESSYASPVIYRDDKQEFLITHGADYVVAHDLKDGHELWRCGDMNPKGSYNHTLRFVASPVAAEGMIVVPSAKQGPVLCLKPGGSGDLSDNTDAFYWRMPRDTPDVPSPIIHDGIVYLSREKGNLIAMDAKSGKQFYDESTTRDDHRSSPVLGDGKIYVCGKKGVVTVAKTGPKFEILAQNDLGEPISASPAISGGRLYIRSYQALYAIGK